MTKQAILERAIALCGRGEQYWQYETTFMQRRMYMERAELELATEALQV